MISHISELHDTFRTKNFIYYKNPYGDIYRCIIYGVNTLVNSWSQRYSVEIAIMVGNKPYTSRYEMDTIVVDLPSANLALHPDDFNIDPNNILKGLL